MFATNVQAQTPPPPTPVVDQTPLVFLPQLKTKEDIINYIKSKDWDSRTAIRIAEAESRMESTAVNDNPRTGDYSIGIFQINIYKGLSKNRPSELVLKNPRENIDFAYNLYKESGWNNWTTYREGV